MMFEYDLSFQKLMLILKK